MTNALYQAAIQELEQVLPPRVVSHTLKEGLRQQNQSPDTVAVEDFDSILKGSVYRQLQVSMPPDQAKATVGEILARLRKIASGEPLEPDPSEAEDAPAAPGAPNAPAEPSASSAALSRQEDELVGLRAALKPFNMYFEWPEVQKLRAQVHLLEEQHRNEREAFALVEEAHRQLTAVRQKLEDHLVLQARDLAELEEAFERVESIGGVKVRRLENLLGHVREAQDGRQLAPAEVERARKIAKDLRKMVESSVYQEEADAATPGATPDASNLSPEVTQRLEQLDREAEQHDVQKLAEDHAHLLDHLPTLAERLAGLRNALERGRRIDTQVEALRGTLAEAAERQRLALREELAQIEAQARDLPDSVDASELLQAVAVANGVLETTLPSLEDTEYVRRLHRLALEKREELHRAEAEAEQQRTADLREQRALLDRARTALGRYDAATADPQAMATLAEALEALAAADAENRLVPDVSAEVRRAEERLEAAVAEHASDARVRRRAQLRALLSSVEGLPALEALGARVAGVKRELVRLIESSADADADPVQVDAVRSLVSALRRDAIDTCRTRLEQLAERASEVDAEELLGQIQAANNVLDDDVYPDLRQLENALRHRHEAYREARFAELRRLERDASEYLEIDVDEATALNAALARSRQSLETGGIAPELRRAWELLEELKAIVERRLADFLPRLDAALEAFDGVAMLNSEDVASVRRILKHLDSQREAFPRVSTGLRIQLERALEEAETLLAKLQDEVDATRAIADRLMAGGVLDDVLGLFGGPGPGPNAPETPAPSIEGDPVGAWLASFTDEPGVEAGAILGPAGWTSGSFPHTSEAARAAIAPLDQTLERLGQELDQGPLRVATMEFAGRALVVAWLDDDRRLLLLLDTPTVLSLIGHRLRTELDDLHHRLRGSPNA